MPPFEVEHRPLLDDLPESGHEPEDDHADAHQREPLERAARIDDLAIWRNGDRVGQGVADDPLGRWLPQMGEHLRLAVEKDPDLTGNAGVLLADALGGDRLRHLAPHVCQHALLAGVEEPRQHERVAELRGGKAGEHDRREHERQKDAHADAHTVAGDRLELAAEERGELLSEAGNGDCRQRGRPLSGPAGRVVADRSTGLLGLRHASVCCFPLLPAGGPEARRMVLDGHVDVCEPSNPEVAEGLRSRAEPDQLAVTENQELVGPVDVVEMVRDHNHRRAGPGTFGEESHDPRLGGRIEAGGRLVDHEKARGGEHFGRQTRPLHLATGEVADRLVPHAAEADLGDDPINCGLSIRRGRSCGKPHLRCIVERPLDRQGFWIDVPLGHVADRAAEGVGFTKHVVPAHEEPAISDLPFAQDRPHERALARPAGTEHADKVTRLDPEAHILEKRLPLPTVTRIGHRHRHGVGNN